MRGALFSFASCHYCTLGVKTCDPHLTAGDADFVDLLSNLRQRGYHTFLLYNSETKRTLVQAASVAISWESFLAEKVPRATTDSPSTAALSSSTTEQYVSHQTSTLSWSLITGGSRGEPVTQMIDDTSHVSTPAVPASVDATVTLHADEYAPTK